MKKFTLFLILCITFNGFSQEKEDNLKHKKRYTSIKAYKGLYGEKLTKEDSLNFVFHNNDTLLPFPDNYLEPKGIKVAYIEKDSAFLEIYEDIVFKKHYKTPINNSDNQKMRYWKDEIKIYFTKNLDASIKKELTTFANSLTKKIDSLKISYTNNIDQSNFIIYGFYSKDDKKYDERIKGFNNDYYIRWNGNQQIFDCKFQLNSNAYKDEDEYIISTKILFLRSLGFLNLTNLLPEECYLSSLKSTNKEFTIKDLELIRYHYSYGICKGTDLETFEKQHRDAKNILKETGRPMYFLHLN